MFKQERFTFVDVVSLIFLFLLFVGNFIGLLFLSSSLWIAAGVGGVIFLSYYGIIRLLKRNKQILVSKHYKTPLSMLFVGFLLLAVISGVLTSHAVNIQFNTKEQVQAEVGEKATLVEEFFTIYQEAAEASLQEYDALLERKLNSYKKRPTQALKDEILSMPYMNASDLDDIKRTNVKDIVRLKKEEHTRGEQRDEAEINQLINQAKVYRENFRKWNWLVIATDYKELNQFIQQSYDRVAVLCSQLPYPPKKLPTLEMDTTHLPLDSFSELNKRYTPNYLLIVGGFLLIHFFVLIPYILEKVRVYRTEQEKDDRIIEY